MIDLSTEIAASSLSQIAPIFSPYCLLITHCEIVTISAGCGGDVVLDRLLVVKTFPVLILEMRGELLSYSSRVFNK